MLKEHAGFWGTQELTDNYKRMTPGQEPGKFAKMKVLELKNSNDSKVVNKPSLPIGGDRIGAEYGYPKEPTFGDNQTLPFSPMSDPIGRWMVKEETRKRFKQKYGELADQKIKEAAMKVSKTRSESLIDPYTGGMSDVSTTSGPGESNIQPSGVEQELTSLFGKQISKRLNKGNKK
jgi:hypothetical protein